MKNSDPQRGSYPGSARVRHRIRGPSGAGLYVDANGEKWDATLCRRGMVLRGWCIRIMRPLTGPITHIAGFAFLPILRSSGAHQPFTILSYFFTWNFSLKTVRWGVNNDEWTAVSEKRKVKNEKRGGTSFSLFSLTFSLEIFHWKLFATEWTGMSEKR